jgi:hypothetical protein
LGFESLRARQPGRRLLPSLPGAYAAIPCPVQAVTGSLRWSSTPQGIWSRSRWITCADRLRWSSHSLGSMIALCQRAARWRAGNHERSVRAVAGGAELHCDQHRRHRWPGGACGTDVWHLRGSGRQGPLAPAVVVRRSCGDRELHRDHVRPQCAQRVRLLALGRRRYPRLGNRTPDRSGRRYR